MQDPLLTAKQVADMLQVRTVTVYAAAASGRIPVVRLWRGERRSLLRFRKADVEAWLSERTVCVAPRAGR